MCLKLRLPIAATVLQHLAPSLTPGLPCTYVPNICTPSTVQRCNRAAHIPFWPVIHLHSTLTLFLERSSRSLKFAPEYISRSRRRPRCAAPTVECISSTTMPPIMCVHSVTLSARRYYINKLLSLCRSPVGVSG